MLSTLYGQTEAPMTIAGLSPAEMARPELRTSVGRLFPDTPVALLDADGAVRTGEAEGEILVRGDLAATVYLDDPEQTDAARHDGWLKTGDIGRLDADGYLFLLGRSKELIISGGYNIYPGEVEAALNAHPAVREACAFGVAYLAVAGGDAPPAVSTLAGLVAIAATVGATSLLAARLFRRVG